MGAEEERRSRERLEGRELIYFLKDGRGIVNIYIVVVLL
jgi:hypothetical protein